MKKLIAVLAVLALIAAGLLGYIWYQTTHIFVEDAAYPKKAEFLDLRGTGISQAHYETVRYRLPNCEIVWDVPIQDGYVENTSTSLVLNGLTEADTKMIRYFANLEAVEIRNCDDYEAMEKLQVMLPDTAIHFQVDLGGTKVDRFTEEVELKPGDYDFDTLFTNLQHTPTMERITFLQTQLKTEQMEMLEAVYPQITYDYTIDLMGTELTAASKEVDLTSMTARDMDAVLEKLPMLAGLERIKLAPASAEGALTLEEVARLKQAAPHIQYTYSFELYGETFTTDDEVMSFKNKRKYINNDTLPQLRLALDIMNNCSKVILDNTAASDAECAKLREDYRGKTEVVWRIYFADYGTCLTDVEVLRIVYDLFDDNCGSLKYLEKVRYMDIGHNEFLDYCDFVSGMPELEVAIISGAPIHSLEPFANCTKLKFLEMANCSYIPDLEPLRNCTELEMLNISHTTISDLSPVEQLPLTHLCMKVTKVEEEARDTFIQQRPDCWITYEGDVDYGEGWRYDADGNKLEWYAKMAQAFHYPNPDNKTGWYLE